MNPGQGNVHFNHMSNFPPAHNASQQNMQQMPQQIQHQQHSPGPQQMMQQSSQQQQQIHASHMQQQQSAQIQQNSQMQQHPSPMQQHHSPMPQHPSPMQSSAPQQQIYNQSQFPAAHAHPPAVQPQSQQPQQKEVNMATLCRIGQETVQELVSRTQEVLQILKSLQPPNGTPQSNAAAMDKKNKLQEQLKTVKVLFKRLRIIYDKCNENSQDLESYPLETMIPTQSNLDDWKYGDKKNTENYQTALDERKELYEQILVKNRHLQEIMDYMRSIMWEINTMLMMRR